MPTPRTTTLIPLTFSTNDSGVPELPPPLEQALVDFGLVASFRARADILQAEYIRAVSSTPPSGQAERIAEILDDLAPSEPLDCYEADQIFAYEDVSFEIDAGLEL